MSEEQRLRTKYYDQTKAKRLVNIGEAFQRWRDLREVKGMKTNAEVAMFLLDRWVHFGTFHRSMGQYCFVPFAACDHLS